MPVNISLHVNMCIYTSWKSKNIELREQELTPRARLEDSHWHYKGPLLLIMSQEIK